MNQKSINKIIETIRSIQTMDQFKVTVQWISNLRQLYNIPVKYEAQFQKELLKVVYDKTIR